MKFQYKLYPISLQRSLQNLLSDDFLCDVKLVVDGEEFQAHKLILSAASPYFRIMFDRKSSFIESSQQKVNMHGIDRGALSDILHFIYSSDININDENVFFLMEAANLLQMHALKTFIGYYLEKSLTLENCIQIHIMADLHNYYDLAEKAFHFLLINFSKLVDTKEFFNVSFEIFSEILSSKLLDVPNEETLYEIVMKWIKIHTNARAQFLEPLVLKLNLNLLSIEFLKKIQNDSLTPFSLQQKIEEIIQYRLSRPAEMSIKYQDDLIQMMRHKAEKGVIFAIGGESSGMASQSVECFTLDYDKWKYTVPACILKRHESKYTNVLPPMRCARYYAASASDRYNVYVVGGRNSSTLLDSCEVFNIRTNQWKYIHKLPEKLLAGGAAILEGELMVMGGYTEKGISDKVWKLDTIRNTWVSCSPMDNPRYYHATIALGGHAYIFGGYDSNEERAVSTCLKFDSGCNKWFKISSMHQPRAKFGCVAIDNFIYVFGGTTNGINCLKSVERYDTMTDEWIYDSSMTIARHSFAVAISDHEIYCVGGSDGTHFLDTVEKFSLRSKRWHCVHSLRISRLAPAAAALLIPYVDCVVSSK